jgi:ribosomal protein S18 acetylase RimI-like enzyme
MRWERQFEIEFAGQPITAHRSFGWDQTDGALGAAREEFLARGYLLERGVGLVAAADQIRQHPRANREVVTRPLAPRGDEPLWDQVVEIQVAGRDPRFSEESHRAFCRRRQADMRDLFAAGHGDWYVALIGDEVVGSCGIVVTGDRGRYQAVDTVPAYQRRGICSRLLVDAAHDAAQRHGARLLVIVADPDYHALGLYESLGFAFGERVAGVCLADE